MFEEKRNLFSLLGYGGEKERNRKRNCTIEHKENGYDIGGDVCVDGSQQGSSKHSRIDRFKHVYFRADVCFRRIISNVSRIR